MKSAVFALLLFAFASSVQATDLTKVDRTIAREPAYQQAPRYVLAVFGKEALTKVWLVLDGETLYVDANSSGDLTGAKRLAKPASTGRVNESQTVATYAPVTITERDGRTKHELTVRITLPNGALRLAVTGPRYQYTGGIDDGSLLAARSAAEAPIVHFGGALAVLPGQRSWPDTALVPVTKHERKAEWFVQAKLGTPGLGQGTTACVNPATTLFAPGSSEQLGPDGPLLEIIYYHTDGKGVPFQAKHHLALTCCCGIYTATVQPPQGAEYNRAKLTYTFPGSSPGLFEVKTHEVDLVAGKEKANP